MLVDFENVQPDLSLLANSSYKVKVFFGAKQQEGRVPFKLLDAMLALGGNVEPIKVMRSGSNAVDMHIAYFIGRLIEREPDSTFHIVSGDTDFDPLAEYLRANGVSCHRTKSIAEIAKKPAPARQAQPSRQPQPRPPQPRQSQSRARPTPAAPRAAKAPPPPPPAPVKIENDKLALILKHLRAHAGKPATRKKLAQAIATYFRQHGGALPGQDVEQLIEQLLEAKHVSVSGNRIAYHLG